MSRTSQASLLGQHLTEVTEVTVTVDHIRGAEWSLNWADGPLDHEMRAHLDDALTHDRHADMRDQRLTLLRESTSRSWAARAIAAHREGALTTAIAEGADNRRLGVDLPRLDPPNPGETHEWFALLHHVQKLQRTTSYPERASAPEDESFIEALLGAAVLTDANGEPIPHNSERRMAHIMLALEQAPPPDQPLGPTAPSPAPARARAPEER
ncbi:hypothetical protein [Streptomyces sp. NPDC053431]|uniref:hypothetical protein n=1 Tax=Streptomyces sp. NPDC053431 TaxID=3365703 RepID=UPI0037D77480